MQETVFSGGLICPNYAYRKFSARNAALRTAQKMKLSVKYFLVLVNKFAVLCGFVHVY